MDTRRLLIAACAGLALSGCARLAEPGDPVVRATPIALSNPLHTAGQPGGCGGGATTGWVPDAGTTGARAVASGTKAGALPGAHPSTSTESPPRALPASSDALSSQDPPAEAAPLVSAPEPVPYETLRRVRPPLARAPQSTAPSPSPSTPLSGRRAIVAANADARAASRSDAFVGGVQVFAWSPGRVFEVWTAPLRVTTLTLGAGETLVSKAAGDTVRWQIGETTSGSGASQRTHVLLKPLERGLETNLLLTTSQRVYLLDLKSGAADGFNAAVAWDAPDDPAGVGEPASRSDAGRTVDPVSDPVVTPQGPLDARYRIQPQGRRARWTPSAVFNDGVRTFITFSPELQVDEAPALFVVAADGETQLVNYRQAGGLFIVDRVFDRAELRLGDRRPQVVRIRRIQGDHR